MRHAVRLSAALLTGALLLGPAIGQDRGLAVPADALGGLTARLTSALTTHARWQARLERDTTALPARDTALAPLLAATPQTLRLMGDYQLDTLRLGDTGGLRLTGGVLINLRSALTQAAVDPLPTLPYAGIGYASGNLSGSWGFSADVGLTASGLGVSLGNRSGGVLGLGMDGGLRDLRLQPVVRLGMNLAF